MDTPATGSQKSEFEADKHEQENLTSVTPAEDLDIDDETKNALNFADLQHAVLELSDFRPIAGPAAVLLERANELYHKGYFEDAMIAYQRALKQAEGGLEHYLVLVILLNGGECSLQVNDHRVIQDRGQEMIQRALEQIDCGPSLRARAACHLYIIEPARCWWRAELQLTQTTAPKKTNRKRKHNRKLKKAP